MGRHHEVRAAAMAKTGAMKSALYARASKEAYMAARTGDPDPKTNLALRAVYDKYRGKSVPKDVFDRAIKKAQGEMPSHTLKDVTKHLVLVIHTLLLIH